MPKSKYKVHAEILNAADNFKILILEVPLDELEDKLAYLAREKGVVTRSMYEDWLIATCVANINQLLYSINQRLEDGPDLMNIRSELITIILKHNKKLDPNSLVMNSNHVIKFKASGPKVEGETVLSENAHWEKSYYDDLVKGPPEKEEGGKAKVTKKGGILKDINDLDYQITQKWWSRIGQYVKIKTYNPVDAESILAKRFFHNRTSFVTFVVSICVEEFDELFEQLDSMGVPSRIAPPILMHELYDICENVNSFLTFENAQALAEEEFEDDEEEKPQRPGRPMTQDGTMKGYAQGKKPSKRRFKDVPKKDLLMLGENMKVFLVGQDNAVDGLVNSIQRASIGLKDPNKPIGSFLFAGRTGVGKTLATKVLADELIKGRDNMITIDCSEFSADHEYAKLIGAPAGYIGHESGGMLTNAVSKNPFSVVVFDEVEKASHKVHELLLQILEEGRLTDGKGKTVSFKDAVLILTSNVGVKEVEGIKRTVGFGDVAKVTEDKKKGALNKALKRKFKPEFLNRIDAIVHFNTLSKKDYMRIIDIELYKLNDNLKTNDTEYSDVSLKFDNKIKNLIYKAGINSEYGARPLKREIEKLVATPLAKKLLEEAVSIDSSITISAYRGKAKFDVEEKIDKPPFYITEDYQHQLEAVNATGEV